MKWVSYIVNGDWWLFIEFPDGRAIPVQRKGRVGDCIRF